LFVQIRGARILVVDDNSINRQVVAELFRECGVTIDFAVNGKEAVAAVCDADYDLVLMDLQMPVMSGYEATAQIRCDPRHAELPIIAMTAHAMSGVREECLAAGMNDYLSKPIHFTELQELLQRWIGPEARARRDSPAGDTDKIS
jgi:CheY-like chemotaxis protein